MKRRILYIDDYNMAGSRWSYAVWLHRRRDKSLALTLTQSARDSDRLPVAPLAGLRSGIDVYRGLSEMLYAAGYEITDYAEAAADEIQAVDADLAAEFRAAPEAIEAEDVMRQRNATELRLNRLKPFDAAIDSYVQRFSDTPTRYPGGGSFGSLRRLAQTFMQEYALKHGALPKGEHVIQVPGVSGPKHDFRTGE